MKKPPLKKPAGAIQFHGYFIALVAFLVIAVLGVSTSLIHNDTRYATATQSFGFEKGPNIKAYLMARYANTAFNLQEEARNYSQLLKNTPYDKDITQKAFHAQLYAGNMAQAIKLAHRLVKDEATPPPWQALFLLAIEAFKQKDYEKITQYLEKGKLLPREAVLFHLVELWSKVDSGQYTSVASLPLIPNLGWQNYLNHALVAEFLNSPAIAKSLYKKAWEKGGKTTDILNLYMQKPAHDTLGESAQKNHRAYIKDLSGTVGYTLFRPPYSEKKATGQKSIYHYFSEALYIYTKSLIDRGYHKLPVSFVQLIRHLDPNHTRASLVMVRHLRYQKKCPAALAVLDETQWKPPLRYEAQLEKILCLRDTGKDKSVMALVEKLVRTMPKNLLDRYFVETVSYAFQNNKSYTRQLNLYNQILTRARKSQEENWFFYFSRAEVLEKLDRWQEATKDLEVALVLSKDNPLVLNYLGYAWLSRNENMEKAIGLIKKAIQKDPKNPYIIDSLGWALYKQGKFDEAVTMLERAVNMLPDNHIINDHLGDAFWKSGRHIEARYQWKHARIFDSEKMLTASLNHKILHGLPKTTP